MRAQAGLCVSIWAIHKQRPLFAPPHSNLILCLLQSFPLLSCSVARRLPLSRRQRLLLARCLLPARLPSLLTPAPLSERSLVLPMPTTYRRPSGAPYASFAWATSYLPCLAGPSMRRPKLTRLQLPPTRQPAKRRRLQRTTMQQVHVREWVWQAIPLRQCWQQR